MQAPRAPEARPTSTETKTASTPKPLQPDSAPSSADAPEQSPAAEDVDLSCESVAGEEDPGASLDLSP